jgi:hypothetical protein
VHRVRDLHFYLVHIGQVGRQDVGEGTHAHLREDLFKLLGVGQFVEFNVDILV